MDYGPVTYACFSPQIPKCQKIGNRQLTTLKARRFNKNHSTTSKYFKIGIDIFLKLIFHHRAASLDKFITDFLGQCRWKLWGKDIEIKVSRRWDFCFSYWNCMRMQNWAVLLFPVLSRNYSNIEVFPFTET